MRESEPSLIILGAVHKQKTRLEVQLLEITKVVHLTKKEKPRSEDRGFVDGMKSRLEVDLKREFQVTRIARRSDLVIGSAAGRE
jgi:hypothetical protein